MNVNKEATQLCQLRTLMNKLEAMNHRLEAIDQQKQKAQPRLHNRAARKQNKVMEVCPDINQRRQAQRYDKNKSSIEVPSFCGRNDPDAYLDWETKLEEKFASHNYSEKKKVRLATFEFMGVYENVWWNRLTTCRRQNGEKPIETWEDMKAIMRQHFAPIYYIRSLLQNSVSSSPQQSFENNIQLQEFSKKQKDFEPKVEEIIIYPPPWEEDIQEETTLLENKDLKTNDFLGEEKQNLSEKESEKEKEEKKNENESESECECKVESSLVIFEKKEEKSELESDNSYKFLQAPLCKEFFSYSNPLAGFIPSKNIFVLQDNSKCIPIEVPHIMPFPIVKEEKDDKEPLLQGYNLLPSFGNELVPFDNSKHVKEYKIDISYVLKAFENIKFHMCNWYANDINCWKKNLFVPKCSLYDLLLRETCGWNLLDQSKTTLIILHDKILCKLSLKYVVNKMSVFCVSYKQVDSMENFHVLGNHLLNCYDKNLLSFVCDIQLFDIENDPKNDLIVKHNCYNFCDEVTFHTSFYKEIVWLYDMFKINDFNWVWKSMNYSHELFEFQFSGFICEKLLDLI